MLISFIPSVLYAQEGQGKFSRVLEGASVPFDAWCFDDLATAKLRASLEFAEQNCQLRLDTALGKKQAQHSLEVSNLNLRINTIKEEMDNIVLIKDKEIRALEAAALKRPNDYTFWWATGGFVAGVATTLAIFFSVN